MSGKQTISAKIGDKTVDRLEEWADEEGISRSQATEHLTRKGLDEAESVDDSTLLNVALGFLLIVVIALQNVTLPNSVGLGVSLVLAVIYGATVLKMTTDIL